MQSNTLTASGIETDQQLADTLREFLLQRRWFRSKARKVRGAHLRDSIAIPNTDSVIVLLDIEFEEGDTDTYLLTVARGGTTPAPTDSVIAHAGGEVLYDALWSRNFSDALLKAIGDEHNFNGEHGRLTTCHTSAFARIVGHHHPHLQAKVSKAEQSNSSVFYGDRFILKVFRKLEAGINPDFEIGRFLTERGFEHSPAVAGHIEYRAAGAEPMSACILQQFVPNRGDAWEYTLEQASAFFERALGAGEPKLPPSEHPMELMRVAPPPEAGEIIGDFLASARKLGERTAQLHIALSGGGGGPDFEPEPFTDKFRDELHARLDAQADKAIALLREKRATLPPSAADDASRVLELEPRIRDAFRQVCQNRIYAVRIRHHGDYHLGQVLYTGDDFVIIDFEGEPARSLEERRLKRAAMRDVAGMIRSFQYAAFSALRKREPMPPNGDRWAAFWTAWVSRAFAEAYFTSAAGHAFLPDDERQRRLLFDVFLLEKALYEVAYELNNRPDWVGIPLRGIAAVMA
jgi:trehalose synthase-fused probable maltokinase